jgi:hypothetical protein
MFAIIAAFRQSSHVGQTNGSNDCKRVRWLCLQHCTIKTMNDNAALPHIYAKQLQEYRPNSYKNRTTTNNIHALPRRCHPTHITHSKDHTITASLPHVHQSTYRNCIDRKGLYGSVGTLPWLQLGIGTCTRQATI